MVTATTLVSAQFGANCCNMYIINFFTYAQATLHKSSNRLLSAGPFTGQARPYGCEHYANRHLTSASIPSLALGRAEPKKARGLTRKKPRCPRLGARGNPKIKPGGPRPYNPPRGERDPRGGGTPKNKTPFWGDPPGKKAPGPSPPKKKGAKKSRTPRHGILTAGEGPP